MDSLLQDLRYSVRTLRKVPGFTTAAVLTLALGIGANTAIFSVVDAVLLKPLSYPTATRLVVFVNTWRGHPASDGGVSAPRMEVWRAETTSVDDPAAYVLGVPATLDAGTNGPQQVSLGRVTNSFFRLFGAKLAVGRTFSSEEDDLRTGPPRQHMVKLLERGANNFRPCRFGIAGLTQKVYAAIDPVGIAGIEADGSNPMPRTWIGRVG